MFTGNGQAWQQAEIMYSTFEGVFFILSWAKHTVQLQGETRLD
jgi:hypothetical protein